MCNRVIDYLPTLDWSALREAYNNNNTMKYYWKMYIIIWVLRFSKSLLKNRVMKIDENELLN